MKNLVNNNLRKPSEIIDADMMNVNRKWKALGKRGKVQHPASSHRTQSTVRPADQYRQVAYVHPVDIKALAEKADVKSLPA